jgi:hypothetical protein
VIALGILSRRWLALAGTAVLLGAVAGVAALAGILPPRGDESRSFAIDARLGATDPSALASLEVLAIATPDLSVGAVSGDPVFLRDVLRPTPTQSSAWLAAKAAGRLALVSGGVVLLGPSDDQLLVPGSGAPVPDGRTLDTSWTRWIVEPSGYGPDAKGNGYSNLNYWNLCSAGAVTVAMYYWQRMSGFPNVTGTAGWFLEPYESEAGAWPDPGPNMPRAADGSRLGTYWSGADSASGFPARGRGYLMYLATEVRPSTWGTAGMVAYSDGDGRALYPTRGGSRTAITTALNWEASGRNPDAWAETYYTSVGRTSPSLDRDLSLAVTLDVGRDGVPVIAAVDTHSLPNWQDGDATPHIRHAVAIVGYDNAASPPTFTYVDTCGRACNARGGNQNGQLHVISQAQMAAAILDTVGSGFVW